MSDKYRCSQAESEYAARKRSDEITRIIDKLHEKWQAYPEMRLCQLVSNITNRDDVFYVGDDVLEERIDKFNPGEES